MKNAQAQFTEPDLEESQKAEEHNDIEERLGFWETNQKKNPLGIKLQTLSRTLEVIGDLEELLPSNIEDGQAVRLYGLLRWWHHRKRDNGQWPLEWPIFLMALNAGAFPTEAAASHELIDLAVGPGCEKSKVQVMASTSSLKGCPDLDGHPYLKEVRKRILDRMLEVECARGDLPTPVSGLFGRLRTTGHFATLRQAMGALGKDSFSRAGGTSRKGVLGHLIRSSTPGSEDTPEEFKAWTQACTLPEARLVQLSTFAPQWAAFAEFALDWKGLEDAAWWIHAHTQGDNWDMREFQEAWEAEISERTELDAADLMEGAVDVDWFGRAYKALGKERWQVVFKAAKYASSGGGHSRAQLFASAMSGEKKVPEIQKRIDDKRNQDNVRALGLVPLRGGKLREKDLLQRYQRLAEFKKQSRKFGSQRQASEGRAFAIAMQNLARTAGYRDPQRLTWAMEARWSSPARTSQ